MISASQRSEGCPPLNLECVNVIYPPKNIDSPRAVDNVLRLFSSQHSIFDGAVRKCSFGSQVSWRKLSFFLREGKVGLRKWDYYHFNLAGKFIGRSLASIFDLHKRRDSLGRTNAAQSGLEISNCEGNREYISPQFPFRMFLARLPEQNSIERQYSRKHGDEDSAKQIDGTLVPLTPRQERISMSTFILICILPFTAAWCGYLG